MVKQNTLKKTVVIEGIGLHSGCRSVLRLSPAPAGTGIAFKRSDVANAPVIQALYSNVCDTRNCTCLGENGILVSTIEHLMAALYAAGVDNVLAECDNQELPIMDGSARLFSEALQSAGMEPQSEERRYVKVMKPVRFEDEKGNYIELLPNGGQNLRICFEIEFPSKIVGRQRFDNEVSAAVFDKEIAPCRTFCEKYQIEYLQSMGLIKGGSLDNAVVLDGEKILNPDGFRVENECVNHKVLDAVGDMFTSGGRVLADVRAFRTGHYHNNELLRKLFADKENYEIV